MNRKLEGWVEIGRKLFARVGDDSLQALMIENTSTIDQAMQLVKIRAKGAHCSPFVQ